MAAIGGAWRTPICVGCALPGGSDLENDRPLAWRIDRDRTNGRGRTKHVPAKQQVARAVVGSEQLRRRGMGDARVGRGRLRAAEQRKGELTRRLGARKRRRGRRGFGHVMARHGGHAARLGTRRVATHSCHRRERERQEREDGERGPATRTTHAGSIDRTRRRVKPIRPAPPARDLRHLPRRSRDREDRRVGAAGRCSLGPSSRVGGERDGAGARRGVHDGAGHSRTETSCGSSAWSISIRATRSCQSAAKRACSSASA